MQEIRIPSRSKRERKLERLDVFLLFGGREGETPVDVFENLRYWMSADRFHTATHLFTSQEERLAAPVQCYVSMNECM